MNLVQLSQQMDKSFNVLVDSLVGIHNGNINTGIIGTVKVDCYGQKTQLQHLSSLSSRGNRISVCPYDSSLLKQIESILKKSGFNAYIFSKKEINIEIPQLSGEQIDKTVSRVKSLGEESKIAIRNIRKKFRSSLCEDDKQKLDNQIQQTTDNFINQINDLIIRKIEQIKG